MENVPDILETEVEQMIEQLFNIKPGNFRAAELETASKKQK